MLYRTETLTRRIFLVLAVPTIFLTIALAVIRDYGISWDEPIHFIRGQAYLHYFLTGNKDYSDIPRFRGHLPYFEEFTIPEGTEVFDENINRRSYFEVDVNSMNYFLENDVGHPPLNDILAAFTNYIFYQKLAILGDIEAHHLFNILCSFLLLVVVSVWAYEKYGALASVVSGLSVSTYPLFFAESQFNIKDPPQAAFFTLTLYAFWKSLQKGNPRWLILSAVSFGLSFGMKFNILFLPFIVGPYLIARYAPLAWKDRKRKRVLLSKVPRKYFFALLVSPLIVAAIFWGSWPFLWQAPVANFLKIFGYYKDIGTGTNYQTGYIIPGGFNLYAIVWIIATTPPVMFLLALGGAIVALFKYKEKDKTAWLWLLWFLLPIARVTVPGSSIYGGVRQLFEYIPAMGLLAGLSAHAFYEKFGKRKYYPTLWIGAFTVLFVPNLLTLYSLHPNQNVYFNFLVGGLPGAREKMIPYWGNSFGNAYKQAIDWLNENAEEGARVALIQGTGLNVPRIQFRTDISYWNGHWSGILREGEYLLELTHNDTVRAYPYAWDYAETFLEPVYEVNVDGVAIAKLWKNDLEHTRAQYRYEEEEVSPVTTLESKEDLLVSLPSVHTITRVRVEFNESECGKVRGSVYTSEDGEKWHREPENIGFPQIDSSLALSKGELNFFFPGREARYVKFDVEGVGSCIVDDPTITVHALANEE